MWTRPCDSVTGTRWTRCTPDSCFIRVYASLPRTSMTTSFTPPPSDSDVERTSVFQRWRSAKRRYISNSSAAQSAASCPPVPARISTITFLPSFGSLGISRSSSFPRSSAARASARSASSRKYAAISGSDSAASICLASSAWADTMRNSR